MALRDSLLNPNDFTITWELVPGRGVWEKNQEKIFADAALAAKDPRIHGVSITDNPGGSPAMAADYFGTELIRLGVNPIVHFTCKDKNRNQIEGDLYALARAGVTDLLVMSGDYPVTGYGGGPKPVFDLDPIHALELIKELNQGMVISTGRGQAQLAPTAFFPGAVVSPFKVLEGEVLTQYYKLAKKVAAGAQFIVTQLGYDARKFHELLLFVQRAGWQVPLIGNIYVLTYGVAKLMHSQQLPGCVVTDELLARLAVEREDSDKGLGARILRAAKMYALLKGMGYAGVHLGGPGLKYEHVVEIIERGEELLPNWPRYVKQINYAPANTFYYFQSDPQRGLNTEELNPRGPAPNSRLDNRFFRLLHRTLFEERGIFYGTMATFSQLVDEVGLEKPVAALEHGIKKLTNDCQQCGDCALVELAYYCPMSQCPKNQRNGPCGGSRDGWCEVYLGERRCLYVRAYERLKPYGEEAALATTVMPPCNWALRRSSSWVNYYLGRDHVPQNKRVRALGSRERPD
ncbi:MAG: methylenetetrahydrofolate reductase C-terminal domain-containing protein [Limnochordia bacterium]|jgi:methylenetetrahydrofolate reductase (NADPH)